MQICACAKKWAQKKVCKKKECKKKKRKGLVQLCGENVQKCEQKWNQGGKQSVHKAFSLHVCYVQLLTATYRGLVVSEVGEICGAGVVAKCEVDEGVGRYDAPVARLLEVVDLLAQATRGIRFSQQRTALC